jgi:hypothetical protein
LTRQQLREQLVLLPDGLLGRGEHHTSAATELAESGCSFTCTCTCTTHHAAGGTALCFKCLWPSRFGSSRLLAAKVLKDGFEPDEGLLHSFAYEASVLSVAL